MEIIHIEFIPENYKWLDLYEIYFENPKAVWVLTPSDTDRAIWKFVKNPDLVITGGNRDDNIRHISKDAADYLEVFGINLGDKRIGFENK